MKAPILTNETNITLLHGAFADNNEITDRNKWKTDQQQIRGGDKERGRKDNGANDLAST